MLATLQTKVFSQFNFGDLKMIIFLLFVVILAFVNR